MSRSLPEKKKKDDDATFSFMARMTMSFLKMVMKSRNRSTQCLKEQDHTLESTTAQSGRDQQV